MVIQADEKGRKAIQTLCAVVVDANGAQYLPFINTILCSVVPIPPQASPDPKSDVSSINPAEAPQC